MSDEATIRRIIRLTRPSAKFVHYNHSDNFIEKTPELENDFHYINYYDENFDSNVIQTPDNGTILIDNSYLSSFAYNLFLCWIYPTFNGACLKKEQNHLLNYNFKKFYGEQLYRHKNCIFSRAVLLETLLFEQHAMVEVFETRSSIPDMDKKARFAASMMSSILSNHEIGHYHLHKTPELWDEILEKFHKSLSHLFEPLTDRFTKIELEEFQCDVIAITLSLELFRKEFGEAFCLRTIAFAFSTYLVLTSLGKSAEATIAHHKNVDYVDFVNLEKIDHQFDYSIELDKEFAERAIFANDFCAALALEYGINFYDDNDEFPFPENLPIHLTSFLDSIMDTENDNDRGIALLVAESLHDHPKGMEYLYLRSKSFVSNREELRL